MARRSTAVRIFLTGWILFSAHFASNVVRETYLAIALGESLSVRVDGYMGLHPDLFDADGIPAPKITYRLSENSQRMLEHGVARGREVLEAAGAKETLVDAPLTPAGWHLMGTARMGTDPASSVVNEWGRCHDVKNLFIVDGSLFVTVAGVNPTNTIQALALYVGDRIKANLANLFD
jgi:choline dehydrogenase-like flavoprotein